MAVPDLLSLTVDSFDPAGSFDEAEVASTADPHQHTTPRFNA